MAFIPQKNGCYNREPLRDSITAQDGWRYEGDTRYPVMREIVDPMTKPCQYRIRTPDEKCLGCKWNQGGTVE